MNVARALKFQASLPIKFGVNVSLPQPNSLTEQLQRFLSSKPHMKCCLGLNRLMNKFRSLGLYGMPIIIPWLVISSTNEFIN